MCGIAGFIDGRKQGATASRDAVARAMNDALRHRGPDDEGVWTDHDTGVTLLHRRLSIIDLSAAGHQPMMSADGRYVITFNGEIYNFQELRPQLEARGVRFLGHSDTEVMVEAFAAYGVASTVERLVGMFTIGVWDRRERALTLVRDRLGIKPLYWAKFDKLFLFGSELKALRAHPGWSPRIDRAAVASFMRHSYVPAPHTIYQSVHKLEPGTLLTLPLNGEPRVTRYWDARAVARQGLAAPMPGSDRELTDELELRLQDAVTCRMIADVPLGAFLSGGVDSSTVAALMRAANRGPVKTFTISSDIAGFDEAAHAAAVARHLGTDHTELTVTADQARDVIPRLPEMYDEPFADASQIPTHLVSAMTRQRVTVALSGDGGDELFAGYNRYRLTSRRWASLSLLPRPLRNGIAGAITGMSPDRWSRLLSILPARVRPSQIGDKLHKLAAVLTLPDGIAAYRRLVTNWEPSEVMPGSDEYKSAVWDPALPKEFPGFLDQMQLLDLITYLPDDILTKVDRASMAVGLEARVPLLDHRVVEFAWRLPHAARIRGNTGKWLLRQVLYRHVPKHLIERPKMGFDIPFGDWLRGPLRNWAETFLNKRRLREAGLVDAARVRQIWQEHLDGRRNWQYLIWDVLMLETWRERWG